MIDEYAKKDTKALKKYIVTFVLIIIFISVVVFIIFRIKNNNKCNDLYKEIEKSVISYLNKNKLSPKFNGDYISISLGDLEGSFKGSCGGNVKYTKVNDSYVLTYNLSSCDICTTENSKWSKFKEKMPKNKRNVDVVAYYNYAKVDIYNTNYTRWLKESEISDEKQYGVLLPKDKNILPKFTKEGQIVSIIKEDEIRYSYRDKMWKWYRNNNAKYSNFSSVAVKGYPNKDTETLIYTEPTSWSLDYPKEEDYRVITKKIGYKWYKQEGKNKVYWNDGAYWPEAPLEGYIKDSKAFATVYSYRDKMWRWYNSSKRYYTSYRSTPVNEYIYKDDKIYTYTSWSDYKPISSINASNKSYREERTLTYSRYMIKYKVKYIDVLDEYLTKDEFVKKTKLSLEDISKDNKYELSIKFKYRYNK